MKSGEAERCAQVVELDTPESSDSDSDDEFGDGGENCDEGPEEGLRPEDLAQIAKIVLAEEDNDAEGDLEDNEKNKSSVIETALDDFLCLAQCYSETTEVELNGDTSNISTPSSPGRSSGGASGSDARPKANYPIRRRGEAAASSDESSDGNLRQRRSHPDEDKQNDTPTTHAIDSPKKSTIDPSAMTLIGSTKKSTQQAFSPSDTRLSEQTWFSEKSRSSEHHFSEVGMAPSILDPSQISRYSSKVGNSMGGALLSTQKELLGRLFKQFPMQELKQFQKDIRMAKTRREKFEVMREKVQKGYVNLFYGSCQRGRRPVVGTTADGSTQRKKMRERELVKKPLLKCSDQELVRHLMEKRDEPQTIKFVDKGMFTVGICNLIAMCFFIFSPFKYLLCPYLYTLQYMVLIPFRFYKYRQEKYEYFLLDFCYIGNVALLSYLWFFPTNKELFTMVFAACSGPMIIASIIFRNSLVFHSWEHSANCFIHVAPFICVYLLRHHPDDFKGVHSLFRGRELDFHMQTNDEVSFYYTWVIPMCFYIIVHIFQALIMYVIIPIPDDPGYLNSYRHLKGTAFGKLLLSPFGKCRETHGELLYYGLTIALAGVVQLPVYLYYTNRWACLAIGILAILTTIWNGASFYVEVFSKRYQPNLQKKEEAMKMRKEKRRGNRISASPPTKNVESKTSAIEGPIAD